MTRLDGIGGHRQEEDLCNVECDSPSNNVYDSQYSLRSDVSRLNQPPTHNSPTRADCNKTIYNCNSGAATKTVQHSRILTSFSRQAGRQADGQVFTGKQKNNIPTIIIIKCITPTTEIPVPAFFICSGTWTILSWQQIVAPSTMIHTFACTHSLCLPFNSQPL